MVGFIGFFIGAIWMLYGLFMGASCFIGALWMLGAS